MKNIKKLLYSFYYSLGSLYLKPIFKLEKRNSNKTINERPAEYAFAFKHLQRLCTGKILDIGSGTSSWPHLLSMCGYQVTATDKIDKYWDSFQNRHFEIQNDDITACRLNEKYQFVTCLSVLEHIQEHDQAIENMFNLLEKDGYLILTFPYNEENYHPNVYKHPEAGYGKDANYITQIFSRQEIDQWLKNTGFKILEQEYYNTFTGKLWTMGQRQIPVIKTSADKPHHLSCLLLQKP